MLPVTVDTLLQGGIIETERIEFKRSWNPEKVLHTICAFANDIGDVGGGYIVIGVEEDEGRSGEVVGVRKAEIPEIEKDLIRCCNMIEPRYVPQFNEVECDGKTLIVIWAFSDISRPFKCPVSIGSNKKSNGERAYYIRRASHTVRANHDEEIRLGWLSSKVTFDDLINGQGTVDDVRLPLLEEYLARVGSGLAGKGKGLQELLTSMRLVRGPRENIKPLNIALMMFNDRPENFFPYARIELVVKSDPAGNDMRERICSGPVDWQLRCVLEFLRNNVVEESVRKVDGRAEAERVFNYPFEAVEEALVNAVYHKDYQIHEPVTVTILPDSLEILSFPGPDPSIPDEAVSDLNMRSTYCRNKRLGDFLKEERLAEGRNTGMGKIVQAVERNGSELPEYITDANRTFLRVVFPIHPRFMNGGIAETSRRSRKRSQEEMESMKDEILDMLANRGAMSMKEIYTAFGYSTVTSGFRRCIVDLMDEGLVEYVYPESPRSSRQKLRLSVRRRIP